MYIFIYIYTQLHSNHIYTFWIFRDARTFLYTYCSPSRLFAYTHQCVDLDAESLVALGDQKVCATPCHADRTTASKVGGRPVRWVASHSRWEPAEGDLNVEGWWVGWLGASCKTDIIFEVCILSEEYKAICRLEVVDVINAVFGVGIFQFKKSCLAPIQFAMNLDGVFFEKHLYTYLVAHHKAVVVLLLLLLLVVVVVVVVVVLLLLLLRWWWWWWWL